MSTNAITASIAVVVMIAVSMLFWALALVMSPPDNGQTPSPWGPQQVQPASTQIDWVQT